jgi:hypothetical protein
MADGWNIRTRRHNPDGGLDLVGCCIVRVTDAQAAELLVRSKMPDTVVWIDSEASPGVLDSYDIESGDMLVLFEGR